MKLLALIKIERKNGAQINPGDVFDLSDKKKDIIDRLVTEKKARLLRDFCLECSLLDKGELLCSWEMLLSFDGKCIAPYSCENGRLYSPRLMIL